MRGVYRTHTVVGREDRARLHHREWDTGSVTGRFIEPTASVVRIARRSHARSAQGEPMRHVNSRMVRVAVALLAVAALAACGDDDDGTSQPSPTTQASATTTTA